MSGQLRHHARRHLCPPGPVTDLQKAAHSYLFVLCHWNFKRKLIASVSKHPPSPMLPVSSSCSRGTCTGLTRIYFEACLVLQTRYFPSMNPTACRWGIGDQSFFGAAELCIPTQSAALLQIPCCGNFRAALSWAERRGPVCGLSNDVMRSLFTCVRVFRLHTRFTVFGGKKENSEKTRFKKVLWQNRSFCKDLSRCHLDGDVIHKASVLSMK